MLYFDKRNFSKKCKTSEHLITVQLLFFRIKLVLRKNKLFDRFWIKYTFKSRTHFDLLVKCIKRQILDASSQYRNNNPLPSTTTTFKTIIVTTSYNLWISYHIIIYIFVMRPANLYRYYYFSCFISNTNILDYSK